MIRSVKDPMGSQFEVITAGLEACVIDTRSGREVYVGPPSLAAYEADNLNAAVAMGPMALTRALGALAPGEEELAYA